MGAREDIAAYMKEWRQTPTGKASLEAQKRRDRAKREATKHLIARHKSEYEHLLAQELKKQANDRLKARFDD